MSKITHIACIPARQGSKGVPFKNRIFFDNTADFIDSENWFDKIIVSTDDNVIMEKAQTRDYIIHERSKELAGDTVSIKAVFESIIGDLRISDEVILWLFYLPLVYKNHMDLLSARSIIERKKIMSLCGFVPAESHPYNCWKFDEKLKNLTQYVKNDVYRRQDLPPAWTHHHYICCFKAGEIKDLNSELINTRTHPFFLDKNTHKKLLEIDTLEQYKQWKLLNKDNYV